VEVDGLLNDFNRELSDYSQSCECSEEELYDTENRLNEINHLKVKYGNSIEEILTYCQEQSEKIRKLEDYETYISKLNSDCEQAKEELLRNAAELSAIRKEQAVILEQAICGGLKELNFPDVQFEIRFGERTECMADGLDDVEFMVSLNPGQPVKPLVDVASG